MVRPMPDQRLDELAGRLERAADQLRAGELPPDRAAALVDECARLAAEAEAALLTEYRGLRVGEIAEVLSRFAGRPIAYHAETLEEAYASRAVYGAPDWEVAGWVTTYVAVANGDLEAVSGDVAALAGHPPVGLAEFLRRNPDSLQHLRS